MKTLRLILFLLGVTGLPGLMLAATRTLTMSTQAVVAPGESFTVPCSASTDQGGNGEQVAYFFGEYSLNGGSTWIASFYDPTTGTTVSRTIPITAGGAGTTIVVRIMSAYRGGTAGDVTYTGTAMDWAGAWTNWQIPPAKYAYITVSNPPALLPGDVIVNPVVVAAGQTLNVRGARTVTTSGAVEISSGGIANFAGGLTVKLEPGFHAAAGTIFRAMMDFSLIDYTNLTDSDADGLPDYWEMLHFGDLTSVSGAMDSDGDGVSNSTEYLAGTNPRLNEAANSLPGDAQVVMRMPMGNFQKVKTDWSITTAP